MTRKNTFKHKEQFLGESSQINLQLVSPLTEITNLVSQSSLVLLQSSHLLTGFVESSLQLGIVFL